MGKKAFTWESLCVEMNPVDHLPGRGRLQRWPDWHSKPAGRRLPDLWWWDESQRGWGWRAGAGWMTGPSWPKATNQQPLRHPPPLCAVQTEPRWARCTRKWEEGPMVEQTERKERDKDEVTKINHSTHKWTYKPTNTKEEYISKQNPNLFFCCHFLVCHLWYSSVYVTWVTLALPFFSATL